MAKLLLFGLVWPISFVSLIKHTVWLKFFHRQGQAESMAGKDHRVLLHFTCMFSSVQFSCVRLFASPWIAALQASLSITNSRSLLKPMSIESVMPSSHLILWRPLLLLPPIPGSFPVSQLFAWGGQSTGVSASASVLPVNTQDYIL